MQLPETMDASESSAVPAPAPMGESVDGNSTQAQQALLEQARAELDALASDLHAIDGELAALATERKQHEVLLEVCRSLDELGQLGGADLFWGEVAEQARTERMRRVRTAIDSFNEALKVIEDRRRALIEVITGKQEHENLLEDALFEAQEEEERRQQEWIIEREISELPARKAVMPWHRTGEEDKRFRKSLASALAICLLFALIVPYIDIPIPERQEVTAEIPERVVRLMLEARRQPPPARPLEPQKPQQQEKVAEQKPIPNKAVAPDKQTPEEKPLQARAEPAEQGILAFKEKFASLKQSAVSPRLGMQARISSADANSAGQTQRAMLTKLGPGSSGGINLAGLSRDVGGGGGGGGDFEGVQVARVSSGISGAGKADRPLSGEGPGLGRTDEEIQIVFDRYKAALYRLYNRELRKDPTLRGQMVLRLTIEPNGSVSFCQLQSTDMNAPDLAAQVVERVKSFDFGAKDVATITIVYPIDFLPAA